MLTLRVNPIEEVITIGFEIENPGVNHVPIAQILQCLTKGIMRQPSIAILTYEWTNCELSSTR
jgi:hypothetical protein